MHVVYTQPEAVDAYRETGTFTDGTVLDKDVFDTTMEALTTGTSRYVDTLLGRFLMVNDQSDKHAGTSPLWGDAWGWSFYHGSETLVTVTTDYREDCFACHETARGQDLVYIQGSPVLKR